MQLGQILMIALAAPGTYALLFVLQRVERSMQETGPDGDWRVRAPDADG